jgi:adenylate cyclase
MTRFSRIARHQLPALAGLVMVASLLALMLLMPVAWRDTLRENAFDLVLALDQQLRPSASDASGARIAVVDIDRRSIEALGAWPWPRDTMARLVEAIAAAKPAAIAVDILFAEPDARSPAELARQLGALTGRADVAALVESLPDGDKNFAKALAAAPATLGFVLDPDQSRPLPSVPIVTRGPLPLDQVWRFPGAIGPLPVLLEAAQGLGALSLPGDADGSVRYVPLVVGAADAILPGIALEAVRLSREAATYLIQSEPRILAVGDLSIPLTRNALLRLAPVAGDLHAARSVSAVDVAEGKVEGSRLTDAIVLIGGSAPELGGLRQTAADPLMPSVQIQADAIGQIVAGRAPRAFEAAAVVEPLMIVVFCGLAVAAGAALSPLLASATVIVAIALAWAGASASSLVADRLVDPLTPSLAAALAFVVTSVTSYAVTRRREALVRHRFEQHLAPAVVRRIVEEPGLMKLTGERREVTAFFTDVEEFTAMTHRATPEALISALDHYFEGVASIVIEHGGMIDKIVGDAVHAFFNAPLDLPDHPRRAVACAVAVRAWAQSYRSRPEPAAIGFGRTRIGIETGPVIVGDVGIRAKLDYTAHGDGVNAAARLEAANKQLGSTICVGPEAAARCDPALFRPLGTITVRGREETLPVYEPWPDDIGPDWRERYLAACRFIDADRERAAALFDALAAERLDDPVPRMLAARLRTRA